LALHECLACVDRIGLSGLGKKGLLVTAKSLSEESLPENRTAALDLIETVLAKMDGDVDKLASICGTAYLSDKARAMIEERWKKHPGSHQALPQKSMPRDDRSRRQSHIPSARAAGVHRRSRRSVTSNAHAYDTSPSPERAKAGSTSSDGLRDELPSFKLQLDGAKSAAITSKHAAPSAPASGPFTFSFNATQTHRDSEPANAIDEVIRQETISSVSLGTGKQKDVSSSAAPSSETGAAASLRARLLKIREKQKEEHVAPAPIASVSAHQPELSPSDLSSPLTETPSAPMVKELRGEAEERRPAPQNSYDALRTCIEELLHTTPPVPEAHPCLRDCTSALKKYHAAISNQPAAAPDMSSVEFSDLRQNISNKTVETIVNLTR